MKISKKEVIMILIMAIVSIVVILAFIGFIMIIAAAFSLPVLENRYEIFNLGIYLMIPFFFLVLVERLWHYKTEFH